MLAASLGTTPLPVNFYVAAKKNPSPSTSMEIKLKSAAGEKWKNKNASAFTPPLLIVIKFEPSSFSAIQLL